MLTSRGTLGGTLGARSGSGAGAGAGAGRGSSQEPWGLRPAPAVTVVLDLWLEASRWVCAWQAGVGQGSRWCQRPDGSRRLGFPCCDAVYCIHCFFTVALNLESQSLFFCSCNYFLTAVSIIFSGSLLMLCQFCLVFRLIQDHPC